MNVEFITKADLEQFKNEISENLTTSMKDLQPKKWLRSKNVREILGISAGTLQNLRINGHIKFSKVGGTLFYDYEDLVDVLNESKVVN